MDEGRRLGGELEVEGRGWGWGGPRNGGRGFGVEGVDRDGSGWRTGTGGGELGQQRQSAGGGAVVLEDLVLSCPMLSSSADRPEDRGVPVEGRTRLRRGGTPGAPRGGGPGLRERRGRGAPGDGGHRGRRGPGGRNGGPGSPYGPGGPGSRSGQLGGHGAGSRTYRGLGDGPRVSLPVPGAPTPPSLRRPSRRGTALYPSGPRSPADACPRDEGRDPLGLTRGLVHWPRVVGAGRGSLGPGLPPALRSNLGSGDSSADRRPGDRALGTSLSP